MSDAALVGEIVPQASVAKPKLARKTRPERGDRRYGHSAVSNGTTLLPGVSNRSTWARRCRDILNEHLSDLGGPDNTSAAERSLARRAAVMATELERLELKFATAGAADADELELYQRTAGGLRRLLEAVGLRRRAKDISKRTPSPEEYAQMYERFRREKAEAEKAKAAAVVVEDVVEEPATKRAASVP